MLEFRKAADFNDVIFEKSGYVARITLNNPDSLNTGVKDFGKALTLVEESDDIKTSSVVLFPFESNLASIILYFCSPSSIQVIP